MKCRVAWSESLDLEVAQVTSHFRVFLQMEITCLNMGSAAFVASVPINLADFFFPQEGKL